MSIKAVITKPSKPRNNVELEHESREAEEMGCKVEYNLPQGLLVSGDKPVFKELEKRGYRVKILPDTNIIDVGSYRINIKAEPKVPRSLKVPSSVENNWTHYLVQLTGPRTSEWIKAIEEQGVNVVEPISNFGIFVTGKRNDVEKLKRFEFVSWVSPFLPGYRIAPNLRGRRGRIRSVSVSVYPKTAVDEVKVEIQKMGGEIVNNGDQNKNNSDVYGILIIELDAQKLIEVARLPTVRWLEFQGPDTLFDERSAQIVAENLDGIAAPNTAPVAGYQANLTNLGLTGAGVTIGIVDSGVDSHNNAAMHQDLIGRMAFFVDASGGGTTVDVNGHGTHVAGIAVGNASSGDTDPQGFLLGQGIAPGSQFGSVNPISTGGPFMSDDDRVQNVVNNNAQVMNNSWGVTGGAGAGYTSRSRTYDQRLRDPNEGAAGLEYLVIISAAGNDGPGANTIGSPWEAKNPIVVGNSMNFRPDEGDVDDIRGIRTSSSRGPAVDGRILPNIVAPGTDIVSARSTADADAATPGVQRPRTPYTDTNGIVHNNHTRMSGTSMAAPHVSGLCGLLIEWWRNRTNGRNPSPALLKALLVNGAEDLAGGPDGNSGVLANIPNSNQGWGRVSLENIVLQAPQSDRGPKIFSDQRHAFNANGQEHLVRVSPVDVSRPMRITLTWTDPPGAVGANPALVNDLDLEVTELATANVYRGNVFANGFSTTGGDFDNLNNVECTYIQNPTGIYEVRIIASNISGNARPPFDMTTPWQDFALVIDNAEVPSGLPVSIVPVIDHSGSMIFYGYVDITRTSSKQFVDLMNINDSIGIVSFGDAGDVEYPTGASPVLQTITGQPIHNAANAEIDGIAFGGCTYMGDGIVKARDLLGPASGSRAMVLLSDGYDNKGCDESNPTKPSALDAVATLPPNMPVYTCAMGPLSDQSLLEQVASITNGQYYYMPTIDDLFEIYNYIRGQVSGDSIIANESATASSSSVEAFVDAVTTEASFTVAWANSKLKFVSGEPKKSNEVSIRLRDPRGQLLHPNYSYLRTKEGGGYVVLKLHEPRAGKWRVEIRTLERTHLRYTVGAFVKSPLRLLTQVNPKNAIRNIPLKVTAQVFDGKDQIKRFKANVRVTALPTGIGGLLAKHKDQLRRVKIQRVVGHDKIPRDLNKLFSLRNVLLKKTQSDIFEHVQANVVLKNMEPQDLRNIGLKHLVPDVVSPVSSRDITTEVDVSIPTSPAMAIHPGSTLPTLDRTRDNQLSGVLNGQFNNTSQEGSYNLVVTASGISPFSNTRFVRKNLISVLVR
jgi:subtilisin family serine protease